jgi:hypothetical protein
MEKGTLILIDTSCWVEALRTRGNPAIRDRVSKILVSGRAALCDFVLLELWNGARGDYERKKLALLEKEVECLPTLPETWALARELARKCRKSGRTVPASDLLIAACGITSGCRIEHCDADFDAILKMHLYAGAASPGMQ